MFFLRVFDQSGADPRTREQRFKVSFGKGNPKRAKKAKVSSSTRSTVAMAHSLRGGAGAGKHHTRTRDIETGRSRRPKHGGRKRLVEE